MRNVEEWSFVTLYLNTRYYVHIVADYKTNLFQKYYRPFSIHLVPFISFFLNCITFSGTAFQYSTSGVVWWVYKTI